MRHDVLIAARLAGCALGALALAACSSMWPRDTDHAGSTSTAPAVTGQNSSTTVQGPPASGHAPNPPTDVTEEKTGPK
ncbi:MAG: hypothetical protein JSR98_12640 [Proteobacteria bacterium]|nr:hypothetical protein [Pseudomonadota bacterium]